MNNLKKLRKQARMTQTEIAKYLGISQNTYSYWENDKVKIDNKSLEKLSELFNCSIDYILAKEENKNRLLTDEQGAFMLQEKLKNTPLVDENGNITETGVKIISDFLINNAAFLKRLIDEENTKLDK